MKPLIVVVLVAVAAYLAPWGASENETQRVQSDEAAVAMATFNIRFGSAEDGAHHWRHRRELCIATLRALEADVIGLQEALAFQIEEILEALPEYVSVGVGRDDGKLAGEHANILVRASRFTIDRCETLWLSDMPREPASRSWGNEIPRVVTLVRLIDRRTGEALWVYNTHFDHRSQPSRERSAAMIAALVEDRLGYAAGEPIVVMGDFNAGEDNPAVRILLDTGGLGLIDSFRAAHADAVEVGTFTAFRDERSGEKIDHILVSQGVRVLDAGIDRTRGPGGLHPSDHDAVWAKVVIEK